MREQHLLDGATAAGKGVRTSTRSRHGLRMVSRYVTYRPPGHVGMTMEEGPWFFRSFSGGWNFVARDDGRTEATWRYNFTVRPSWLRFVADPIGRRVLGRDIRRRLDAFARAAADPAIREALASLPQPMPDGGPPTRGEDAGPGTTGTTDRATG